MKRVVTPKGLNIFLTHFASIHSEDTESEAKACLGQTQVKNAFATIHACKDIWSDLGRDVLFQISPTDWRKSMTG